MTGLHGGARERAGALIDLGRYEEAATAAREGLAADPNDLDLAILLAVALSQTGKHAEALPVAQRAVTLQPGSAWAQRTLGWVLYMADRHPEAADQLTQALTLDPHDATSHVIRAEALMGQAQGLRLQLLRRNELIADAERHAEEAVRLDPDRAGGYLAHAMVWVTRGEPAPAEAWGRQALSVEPDNPGGHEVLGMAAELRGDTRAAADCYLAAGKLDPRSDIPLARLRSLRATLPISGMVVIGLGVGQSLLGRYTRGFVGLVVFVVTATVALGLMLVWLAYLLGSRWWARRSMSDEARGALKRDRALQGRRLRLH